MKRKSEIGRKTNNAKRLCVLNGRGGCREEVSFRYDFRKDYEINSYVGILNFTCEFCGAKLFPDEKKIFVVRVVR